MILTFLPFWLMIVVSLKSLTQVYHSMWAPEFPLQWANYVLAGGVVKRYLMNRVRVTGSIVLGVLAASPWSAFAFARYNFPGRTVLFSMIISHLMVPAILTLVPAFVWVKNLGRLTSRMGLILPSVAGHHVFALFVLRSFMASRLFQAFADVGPAMGPCACHTRQPRPAVAGSSHEERQESAHGGERSFHDQQKVGRATRLENNPADGQRPCGGAATCWCGVPTMFPGRRADAKR